VYPNGFTDAASWRPLADGREPFRQTDRPTRRRVGGGTADCPEGWTDGQTDRQTDKQTDRQGLSIKYFQPLTIKHALRAPMDMQTDRQTDRVYPLNTSTHLRIKRQLRGSNGEVVHDAAAVSVCKDVVVRIRHGLVADEALVHTD
jgi:hypothetical protein